MSTLVKRSLVAVAMAVGMVGTALAGTSDTEFQAIFDKIIGWANGYAGKSLAVVSLLIGIMAGIGRSNFVPVVAGAGSNATAEAVELTAAGSRFCIDSVPFQISLPGRHGVMNVTAGVAAGSALGIPLEVMAGAASTLRSAFAASVGVTWKVCMS